MEQIIKHFPEISGEYEVKPLGQGLINDTFLVETKVPESANYVLQRINNSIFTDVDLLQHNIECVTAHLRRKLAASGEDDIDRKVLRFLKADNGLTYYFDGAAYWRISVFIPDSETRQSVTAESAYDCGVAFGNFEATLVDIPDKIGDTIPRFHDISFRLEQLDDAVAADAAGRACEVTELVNAIRSRTAKMTVADTLAAQGKLEKRICHHDTKVNNMLYDTTTGKVLCVIDLDTVMRGYIFSDYGDFLRTAACSTAEDEPDTSKIHFVPEIFKQFTRGYLDSQARNFLTTVEIEHLPYAIQLFPYMQCVRFLADYLNGDTYYKIKYPEHNLVRARAQFQLLLSIESQLGEIDDFVKSLA